jgi:hypothetical protein
LEGVGLYVTLVPARGIQRNGCELTVESAIQEGGDPARMLGRSGKASIGES